MNRDELIEFYNIRLKRLDEKLEKAEDDGIKMYCKGRILEVERILDLLNKMVNN